LRAAQLAADVPALARLISDDLLFAGPDGQLATKAQDLEAHGSGIVRFRSHVPEELRVRRVGADVVVTSLRARLDVEVVGAEVDGKFMSAFVRAVKPAATSEVCCGPTCCS